MRYALAAAGGALALAFAIRWIRARRRNPAQVTPFSIAIVVAALLLVLAGHHAFSPPFDDESWRLIAAQSFLEDIDFDLSNQYSDETWRSFRDAGPSYFTDHARDSRRALAENPGTYYSTHAVGFPILIAPFLAAGQPFGLWAARFASVLPIVALSALLAGLLFRVLRAEGLSDAAAFDAVILFAATAPFGFFGVHLWPEWPAALAGLWSFDRLRRPNGTALEAAAVAAATFAPALFHERFAFQSFPLCLWALVRYARRPAALMAYLVTAFTVGSAVLADFLVRQDAHTWHILGEVKVNYPTLRKEPFFGIGPLFDSEKLIRRIIGPVSGIIVYCPWLLLLLRRGALRGAALPALACASLLSFTILISNFESGPLGRYWAAPLPFLLILAARSNGLDDRLTRILLALGGAKAAILLLFPVACHDAVFANHVAREMGRSAPAFEAVIRPVVLLLLG